MNKKKLIVLTVLSALSFSSTAYSEIGKGDLDFNDSSELGFLEKINRGNAVRPNNTNANKQSGKKIITNPQNKISSPQASRMNNFSVSQNDAANTVLVVSEGKNNLTQLRIKLEQMKLEKDIFDLQYEMKQAADKDKIEELTQEHEETIKTLKKQHDLEIKELKFAYQKKFNEMLALIDKEKQRRVAFENKIMAENGELEQIEEEASIFDSKEGILGAIYLTKVRRFGNNAVATIYVNNNVMKLNEGERIIEDVFVKKIKRNSIIASKGSMDIEIGLTTNNFAFLNTFERSKIQVHDSLSKIGQPIASTQVDKKSKLRGELEKERINNSIDLVYDLAKLSLGDSDQAEKSLTKPSTAKSYNEPPKLNKSKNKFKRFEIKEKKF